MSGLPRVYADSCAPIPTCAPLLMLFRCTQVDHIPLWPLRSTRRKLKRRHVHQFFPKTSPSSSSSSSAAAATAAALSSSSSDPQLHPSPFASVLARLQTCRQAAPNRPGLPTAVPVIQVLVAMVAVRPRVVSCRTATTTPLPSGPSSRYQGSTTTSC